MNHDNRSIYSNFFNATVGRFYTKNQRFRLLRLFTLSSGVPEDSEEFKSIFQRVDALDKQKIISYTESKNYSIVRSVFAEDEETRYALNALVAAHKSIAEMKDGILYESKVAWMIALRKAPPENTEVRMELALLEYSLGNIPTAIDELMRLVNSGSLTAIEFLSCIHKDNREYEAALYYCVLLKKIYTEELKMIPTATASQLISNLLSKIPIQRSEEIIEKVKSLPSFFDCDVTIGKPIGFVESKSRRFAYEYQ